MANRVREKQINVRVTDEERILIENKLSNMHKPNLGEYMRKMAINGEIHTIDISELKRHTEYLSEISKSISNIARKKSSQITADDIASMLTMISETKKTEKDLLRYFKENCDM